MRCFTLGAWSRTPSRQILVAMLYKVEATLAAGQLLSRVPGLRHRVEEMLTGILETAEELRRLQQGMDFAPDGAPMRVNVGQHVVGYVLDLDRRSAKVVFVEPARRQDPNAGSGERGLI